MTPALNSGRVLIWGVHGRFREYVTAVGGTTRPEEGASLGSDGLVSFPSSSNRPPGDALAFDGRLTFEAHQGILTLRLRSLRLERVGHGVALTIMHPGFRGEVDERIVLAVTPAATIHLDDAGATIAHPRLTPDGVAAFGGVYQVGTQLDPIRVVWPAPPSWLSDR